MKHGNAGTAANHTLAFLPNRPYASALPYRGTLPRAYAPALNNGFIADDFMIMQRTQIFDHDPWYLFSVVPENFRSTSYVVFELFRRALGYDSRWFYAFERSASTMELVKELKRHTPVRVLLIDFPYPEIIIAKAAALAAPGWRGDLVKEGKPGAKCAECLVLRWDPGPAAFPHTEPSFVRSPKSSTTVQCLRYL